MEVVPLALPGEEDQLENQAVPWSPRSLSAERGEGGGPGERNATDRAGGRGGAGGGERTGVCGTDAAAVMLYDMQPVTPFATEGARKLPAHN